MSTTEPTNPPPAPAPLRLAVGETIELVAVGVDAGWSRRPLPASWRTSWGAVSGGPVRLASRTDGTCTLEAVEKGETEIQVDAGPWRAYQRVQVVPSPIVGVAIVPRPSDHSAGSYAYPGTNSALAWQADRSGQARRASTAPSSVG